MNLHKMPLAQTNVAAGAGVDNPPLNGLYKKLQFTNWMVR